MPNPCSDFVTISTCARGLGNFKIYNHLGQWIKEVDSNESVWTFSTTNWTPGVYYIFSVDKESWFRFIKM